MACWGVLSAGSWGTALALALARNGHAVRLWHHDPEQVARLRAERANNRYLPGVALDPAIEPTADLAEAVAADQLLVVVPSHAFRELLGHLAPLMTPGRGLAWATKGLDAASGGLLHHVAAAALPESGPFAVLSGPSFAREVAAGLPTAVTVASPDPAFAAQVAQDFHSEQLRVYTCHDIVGVELGGSVKNVLAIATGVADGLGFGANARAALITRGLAELMRLGAALGAEARTLTGLAGVGDLILTCTDNQSRNRRMGLALGKGQSVEQAQREIGQTVEGVRTAQEVYQLSRKLGVEMPVCEQVYRLLNGEIDAAEAVRRLMLRSPKPEFWG